MNSLYKVHARGQERSFCRYELALIRPGDDWVVLWTRREAECIVGPCGPGQLSGLRAHPDILEGILCAAGGAVVVISGNAAFVWAGRNTGMSVLLRGEYGEIADPLPCQHRRVRSVWLAQPDIVLASICP